MMSLTQKIKKAVPRLQKNLFKKILFVDKKIFTGEQKFNKQNDKVYAQTFHEAKVKALRIQKSHHLSSETV